MKDIAILTALFDYPENYLPTFHKNASKYFNVEDIHIVRNSGLVESGSYYDKLYFYKVVKVLEYIEEHIKGKYEYILFLDATDTNFISSPNNLIDKFKTFSCSIVMGAEKGLWPITNFTHLYEKKPILTEYKYLNSGTYFGYTEKIIDHMNQIIDKNHQLGIDDQGKWTIQYLLSDDIIIDQNQDFFFSTFNSKDKILIDRDDIKLVDSLAFVVHDNGGHNEQTIKLTDLLNR
jgi:hypothetical protein